MRKALLPVFLMACDVGLEGDGELVVDCTGAEPYVAGMGAEVPSGLTVQLVEATPTPPDRGTNDWVVRVVDADGSPQPGLPVAVRPWMPLHGHGLNGSEWVTGADQGDGSYVVETFDLFMPGLWEFTIAVSEDRENSVVFNFCAEG